MEDRELHLRIQQLEAENRLLRDRLRELERRLGLDSGNSGKPPSSDGLRKRPSPRSLRKKGEKPSGGQAGHKGETLKQVSAPDEVVCYSLRHCAECGDSLSDQPVDKVVKRQVFDIDAPRVAVTEYRVRTKRCRCGHLNAAFPAGVNAPAQYGSRIKTLAVYFSNQQFIPEDRLQQVFSDVFQLSISTATLVSMNHNTAIGIQPCDEARLDVLKAAELKHFDETGLRIGGKTQWLHVISNSNETHYRVSEKRGEVLTGVSGIAVHDHWKPYFTMEPGVEHALCNAHHLRELQALEEIEKEPWARKMGRFLRFLSRFKTVPPPSVIKRAHRCYDTIVAEGLQFHEQQPPLSSRKNKRRVGHNLLLRLLHRKTETLRFLEHPAVPFTNNQAEQDIRMMKVKQKISGAFRTSKGAQTFCRIRGFISTARKQNRNIFQALNAVVP